MKTAEDASSWWGAFPMWGKVMIAWLGNIWGAITPHLGSVVLIATLIYRQHLGAHPGQTLEEAVCPIRCWPKH